MRKLVGTLVALLFVLAVASAQAATVVIPDPSPNLYIYYGTGDASVTYDGVVFTQQAAIGNANLFDVGPLFSGVPAVLSSQEASTGLENILITLPTATTFMSLDYGTFDGSDVTFLLGNGSSFTYGSTPAGYNTPDFVTFSGGTPWTTLLITSPDFVLNINNITYGSSSTPEPGTMMLLGSGIVGLAGVLRRKINM